MTMWRCSIKHDETGELFYPSNLPYTGLYGGYPSTHMTDFIESVHRNGLLVYAWMPMFNDRVLHQAMPEYRMFVRQGNDTVIPVSDWVSPVIAPVRQHRARILEECLNSFSFDGVRIDHSRYEPSEYADMSNAARSLFEDATGTDPIDLTGTDHPLWDDWLNWRADWLSQFNLSIRDLALNHSAQSSIGAYVFKNDDYSFTWSGQRYEDYGQLGLNLAIHPMPMVYWQDWSAGDVGPYISSALKAVRELCNPTQAIPVFSVAQNTSWGGLLTEEEIHDYMELCGQRARDYGVSGLSYL